MGREQQRTEQLEQRFRRMLDELKEQDAQMAALYEDFDIDKEQAAEHASHATELLGEIDAPSAPAPPRVVMNHQFVLRA